MESASIYIMWHESHTARCLGSTYVCSRRREVVPLFGSFNMSGSSYYEYIFHERETSSARVTFPSYIVISQCRPLLSTNDAHVHTFAPGDSIPKKNAFPTGQFVPCNTRLDTEALPQFSPGESWGHVHTYTRFPSEIHFMYRCVGCFVE